MKVLILHAHWNNRGDEAAIRAMIDKIWESAPETRIWIQIMAVQVLQFPYPDDSRIEILPFYPTRKNLLELPLIWLFRGRFPLFHNSRAFCRAMKNADLVIHAPGGPSLGDIYQKNEWQYLLRLMIAVWFRKPLFFYAPSMGPFQNKARNRIRRLILNQAAGICLREDVSRQYLDVLQLKKAPWVTLDAALQNSIDFGKEAAKFASNGDLQAFFSSGARVIGITITDLQWNPKYKGNGALSSNIRSVLAEFISYLIDKGYKIIFIPQLFGEQNDSPYMKSYITGEGKRSLFVLPDTYDAYFQQFLISKLFAVIGMRYHSNIFAAKMGTPFISISYEQKMRGFMEKVQLTEYCLDIQRLSLPGLTAVFEKLESAVESYRNQLAEVRPFLARESGRTHEYLTQTLAGIGRRNS